MILRWLYHAVLVADDVGDPYEPSSLRSEGFIHASYAPSVAESVALYFPKDAAVHVLQIDPRLLRVDLRIEHTPRGPMPHVHGAIPRAAIVRELTLDQLAGAPDAVSG